MTKRMYKTCTAVLSVALAIVVGWSVTAGNAVVPIVAVAVAVGLAYLCRKATKEVTGDERTSRIYEKASAATMLFLVPAMGLTAVVLLSLKENLSVELVFLGEALGYSVCMLLVVHLARYSYFSRKL